MPNQYAVDNYPTSPSEPALFPFPTGPEGLLSRDQNPQPDMWNPHGKSGNVFAGLGASASAPYAGNAQFLGTLM